MQVLKETQSTAFKLYLKHTPNCIPLDRLAPDIVLLDHQRPRLIFTKTIMNNPPSYMHSLISPPPHTDVARDCKELSEKVIWRIDACRSIHINFGNIKE